MDLFDAYSFVHFSVGVISYYLKINLSTWFILITLFELIQNVQCGSLIDMIKAKITPFSQQSPESTINSIGDILSALLGWICAYYFTKYYYLSSH
jgi:hypothetical protein